VSHNYGGIPYIGGPPNIVTKKIKNPKNSAEILSSYFEID